MAKHTEREYQNDPLYRFAVTSKLYRPFKILRGIYRTFVRRGYKPYNPDSWWDAYYDGQSVSDETTINPGKERLPTLIHYNAVENLIYSHLFNEKVDLKGSAVLDIGSGAGHWLDYYKGLGARRVTGVEISSIAAKVLQKKFADDDVVNVINGDATKIEGFEQYDVVNAIGVLFHIVDTAKFDQTITLLLERLKPGGLLIVGGHFGLIDNLDVQFDSQGHVNKRLRSKRHWKRLLRSCEQVVFYQNDAYRLINATLPENNILIAVK